MLAVGAAHSRGGLPVHHSLSALIAVAIAVVVGLSLLISTPRPSTNATFEFPPFRLLREDYAEGRFLATYELEWRGRNDWTETRVQSTGAFAPGRVQEAREDQLIKYVDSHAVSFPLTDGSSAHVPGIWFRYLVATLPSPHETRTATASIVTVGRKTPMDAQEWDADVATGIPLGYRQIVDGVIVRESRVTSLVLADGTVIR